jgi:hypothetical protein
LTIREIAAERGLPKTTVQDALARAGAAIPCEILNRVYRRQERYSRMNKWH